MSVDEVSFSRDESRYHDSATVNGHQLSGGFVVARNAELTGLAFTPEGANPGTVSDVKTSGTQLRKVVSHNFGGYVDAVQHAVAQLGHVLGPGTDAELVRFFD